MNDKAHSAILEALGEAKRGRWLIRVIRAGLSKNGNYYPDTALREAAGMFASARVFEKSDAEHLSRGGKSIRNLIGGLENPRFVEGTRGRDTGEIVAELVLIEPDGAVATKLRSAHERGLSALFGFSIDAEGNGQPALIEGVRARRVTALVRVNSVDLIVEPGAGGQLITAVEAVAGGTQQSTENSMELRNSMIAAIQAKRPDYTGEGVSDEQLLKDYSTFVEQEAGKASGDPAAEGKAKAKQMIEATRLPAYGKARLRERFCEAAEPFTEKQLKDAIAAEISYLAGQSDSGKVQMGGIEFIEAEDRGAKVADMLDAFFDPAHKNHGAVRSFRECYIEATGDRNLSGDVRFCDRHRLRESAGLQLREAVLSTSWANVLGDAITRRMLKVFAGETDLQAWRKVASVVPVPDFRTQERLRVGGYGNLPAVAEAGPYTALTSPGDEKATYAVSKRGGIEEVTLEAIINDDAQAIRLIPDELALAAANTLYEFVFDFFRTNPAIYDGVAFFHADRGNLFSGALDATAFAAHRLAMATQTRDGSGKRLGIKPRTLLVPFELEEAAYNLFVRDTNLDADFVQNVKPEVVTVTHWADGTDWCTVADPAKLPAIEVGFLNGKEEPELFVQDMPNAGSLFSNDKITYKIRHIYGGTVPVDGAKAATKAVVA